MARLVLCLFGFVSRYVSVQGFSALSPLDPSSFSRPEFAVVKHISLAIDVNFDTKILKGIAKLNFEVLQEINEVILDVSELNVEWIESEGKRLNYTIDNKVPSFGSKLKITLDKTEEYGGKIKLIIKYSTSPDASALQWLEPAQTSGKQLPYLFSQSSPIHARSILPCQDTPAVKFTYDAEISAPPQFTVLMSALRGEVNGNVTSFNQPVPIPPNLMAIAVGDLEFRSIGPRSKVWSEKEMVDRSAWEFADTEKYLQAAEGLCGPYVWTQYDLLVLPPSFPYGGMENPCLTFVTPTLLAGDRSQADVIVHEIIHSWTGNLVTNRNFEHFWLKEGFTVFLERKATASLIDDEDERKKSRDFDSILGLQALNETIAQMGSTNPLTKLVLNLKGVHPDDAFSTVPYEKGSLFIRYLEDLLGGPEVFDKFIRSYLYHFARKSLDTDQFKSYLLEYFKDNEQLKTVDWDVWLNGAGMPPIVPDYDRSMTKSVTALVEHISSHGKISSDDVSSFSPQQMIHFLQSLLEEQPLPIPELRDMADKYGLIRTQNAEIQFRYTEPEVFDKFIRSYLYHFARKSLDTDQFKSYLLEYFKDNEQLKTVDWDVWLNGAGMPPIVPDYDRSMTKSVTALVEHISSHGKISSDDVSSFSPQQMIHFLQSLLEEQPLPIPELRDMADKYGLIRTQNAEIQFRWLRLSIKSKDMDRLDDVFKFVNAQGRMKYVRPVYRDMYAWEAVRERAVQNFLQNEKYMMHVSAYTLRKDLHL